MKNSNIIFKLFLIATAVLLVFSLIGCNVTIPGVEFLPGAGSLDTQPNGGTESNGGENTGSVTDGESGTSGDSSSGEQPSDGNEDEGAHSCVYELVLTIPADCKNDGMKVYRCSCGDETTETLYAAHTPITVEGKAPTCTDAGYTESIVCDVCNEVIDESIELEALPHAEVKDPAVEATETSPAMTEGKHCSVCGYVIVKQQFVFSSEYSTPDNYDGSYAYQSLLLKDNGEQLAKLYALIDEEADYFHSSGESVASNTNFIVATIDFSELGIAGSDALAVWSAYRADHPLYYWISSSVSYTDKKINLHTYEEYADGAVRSTYNSKIYSKVEALVSGLSSASTYTTALAFHDSIIRYADYAYEDDGVTPSSDPYAHNIIGVLDTGYGVCESYAKAFQLLLNFCNIENIFVAGSAGGPHAWNLVKLDDGEWYWYDLTWDDTPDFMWGISYRYFCVNDTDDLSGSDGPWASTAQSFIVSHIPYSGFDTGIDYTYDLPARSETSFEDTDALLRSTFTVSGLTYAISGYGTVQLVAISGAEEIIIPETVEYHGTAYTVTSIGVIEKGLFKTGSIAYDYDANKDYFTTEYIKIPKSVVFIWDNALNIDSLAEIEVDSDNEYFTSVDGVLFTKELYTLIKYPPSKTDTEYAVPDETVQIAAGAFSKFYSNRNLSLTKITLGANTVTAGAANYGYGYTATYEQGNFVDGEWDNIRSFLSGSALIYTKSGELFV